MMRKGNERKSPSSSPRLDCDVGLQLQQPTDSYYCDGGGPNFYGVADALFLQRSFHDTACRGGIGVCGKALFTTSQWQELEKQKMIHKYIVASIPVPPQLLLPTSSRSPPPSLSQYNTSGLDLRFSAGGSDPEPWRCKRTDGKKWRCSRDVAPDLKYCERHAHKSRPRSRKLVEISSHKPPTTSITTTTSISQFPSYDQTRGIEWFMKGGSSDTNSVATHKQQWEHVMHHSSSSPRMSLYKNTSLHHSNFEDKQADFMTLNPYIPDTSNLQHNNQSPNPILDSKMKSLTQTRHFIDAWEKEGYQGLSLSPSLSTEFPISPSPSSLSLSMCGGDYDSGKGALGIGMMISERESEGVLKPQWMNSVSWMNSPLGGPLGEALCLGNASTTRGSLGSSNLEYGYCNTSTNANTNTNSSICSKSYGEDGSYALNFIGDS